MSERRRARAGLQGGSVGQSQVPRVVPEDILSPDHPRWHDDAEDLWSFTLADYPVPQSAKAAACRLGRITRWSDGVSAYAVEQGWMRGTHHSFVDHARLEAAGVPPLRRVLRERLGLMIACGWSSR